MKNKYRYSLFLLSALGIVILTAFYPMRKQEGFTLKGSIDGVPAGKIYLNHSYHGQEFTDSATVKEGSFTFKGKVSEPLLYTLKLAGTKQQKVFFVENSMMQFSGTKDSLYKAKVTGSVQGDLYNEFYTVKWKPVQERAGQIYKRMDIAGEKGKKKLDPETRKKFDDEFTQLSLFNDTIINEFVKQHLNDVAAAVIIEDRYISYPYPDLARALYAKLDKNVQNSVYGKEIKAAVDLDAKTGFGKSAPEFSQPDTAGKMVSLHNFKGKYVLVDFWASWCAPCRAENPNVVKAYKKYHDKGFEILSVSLDSKKEAWMGAIHKDGLTWNHVSDLKGWNNAAAAEYGIKSVPASYLLDKEGKILAKGLRGEALDKKLAELMK